MISIHKRRTGIVIAACLAGLALPAFAASPATIYYNGQVYTPDGWQTAFAVRDGRIVAVGSDAEIRKTAGAARTVDLGKRTVLPGLFDMHVHPTLDARGYTGSCKLPQEAGAKQIQDIIAACVKMKAPGEWLTGGQWQASSITDGPMTAQTLDAVSPNNPVTLVDISGHSIWANSKALAVAGITKGTPNPEGGIIERDADGNPTGLLRESASELVTRHMPPQPIAETKRLLGKSLDHLLSYGITGFVEAVAMREDLEIYADLADKGALKQHVQACIASSMAGHGNSELDATIADIPKYTRERFKPTCVKVFADGVPTDSHTGAMLEAYQAGQPNAPAKGLLLFDPATLNPQMAKWDKLGLTVLFHAAGDWAVRASLDAVAYAREQNGNGGPIHQVGHLTFVDPADLPRAKALNAAFEYSPYLWDPQPISDDITKAVGEPRISRVWPIKDGFDAGALVIAGSDWIVVTAPDPWLGIETAITRQSPGGSARTFGAGQAITLDQAIRMFTINAATRLGLDKELGTIESGKRADFIVIDKNPFRIPATEIHTIKVEKTYIDGEAVFERTAAAGAE